MLRTEDRGGRYGMVWYMKLDRTDTAAGKCLHATEQITDYVAEGNIVFS